MIFFYQTSFGANTSRVGRGGGGGVLKVKLFQINHCLKDYTIQLL